MKKNYALVLGGGGGRGYAHIGVIRYIEENGINIVETAGTSMGAIISACFATGKTSSEMENILKNINFLKLLDFDFKHGIISGKQINKFLYDIFGNTLIEEVKIPLRIVATNLNDGSKKIFDSGRIVDAIRASIGIPTIFSPYEINGSKFIDGGLRENLPVLEVKQKDIIAVSVVRDKLEIKIDEKFFKFFKNSYKILKKSISIIMANNEDLTLEIAKRDGKNIILLKPDVSEYEYYDLLKFDEIIKKGYESCKNVIF